MKVCRSFLLLALFVVGSVSVFAQTAIVPTPFVDFDSFEKLVKEVKTHRKSRLVSLDQFVKMSKEANTVILDTRSDKMFAARHIAGAKHLDFTEFTQENLARTIPSQDTRILIYCNNNFSDDSRNFATKIATAPVFLSGKSSQLTLALNIPTYINLFGYGYKNVYELSELVSVRDVRLKMGGAAN